MAWGFSQLLQVHEGPFQGAGASALMASLQQQSCCSDDGLAALLPQYGLHKGRHLPCLHASATQSGDNICHASAMHQPFICASALLSPCIRKQRQLQASTMHLPCTLPCTLPSLCHASAVHIAMHLPCVCHASAMHLPRICGASGNRYSCKHLPCICHVSAVHLSCFCHAAKNSDSCKHLPCTCQACLHQGNFYRATPGMINCMMKGLADMVYDYTSNVGGMMPAGGGFD